MKVYDKKSQNGEYFDFDQKRQVCQMDLGANNDVPFKNKQVKCN